jgi:anti-sigma B factor antagonist
MGGADGGQVDESELMHWTEIAPRLAGSVVILDLKGQMTLSGDEPPHLLRRIRGVVEEGHRHVVLNLAHVSFVDSTGIGEIVGAYTRVVREGGMLKLCGVSPRIQELLDTTNLGSVIESYGNEADAVESF